jgi:hypothetical protein
MDMRLCRSAILGVLTSVPTACGGRGGDSPLIAPTNASPGGIWRGTESVSGLQVVGLADKTGEFHFIRTDHVQEVGTATVSGNNVSANHGCRDRLEWNAQSDFRCPI